MEEAVLVKQQARVGKMLLTNLVSEEERMWEMSEWITDQLTNIVIGQIIVALVRKLVAVILTMMQALITVIHYA